LGPGRKNDQRHPLLDRSWLVDPLRGMSFWE
jgi:hypothetical protein